MALGFGAQLGLQAGGALLGALGGKSDLEKLNEDQLRALLRQMEQQFKFREESNITRRGLREFAAGEFGKDVEGFDPSTFRTRNLESVLPQIADIRSRLNLPGGVGSESGFGGQRVGQGAFSLLSRLENENQIRAAEAKATQNRFLLRTQADLA